MNISSAHALLELPTSGSCGFVITEPIPYGVTNSGTLNATGYNFMGLITFNSKSSATLNGVYVNVKYSSSESPQTINSTNLNNATVVVAPMTTSNGFIGGYKLFISGRVVDDRGPSTASLTMNAIPVNNGKTILLQFADGTQPGSGVCQFQ